MKMKVWRTSRVQALSRQGQLNYTDWLPGPLRSSAGVSALIDGVHELGIDLTPAMLAQLDQLGAALREGNRRVNLTRITDPTEVETRHFLDSLTAAIPLLDQLRGDAALRLVDIGSGGGLPGLPLKIVFRRIRLTLVESI